MLTLIKLTSKATMSWWAMTQLAQRRAEQEKQLATAGEEDLQPVQAGPKGKFWRYCFISLNNSTDLKDRDWHPLEETSAWGQPVDSHDPPERTQRSGWHRSGSPWHRRSRSGTPRGRHWTTWRPMWTWCSPHWPSCCHWQRRRCWASRLQTPSSSGCEGFRLTLGSG